MIGLARAWHGNSLGLMYVKLPRTAQIHARSSSFTAGLQPPPPSQKKALNHKFAAFGSFVSSG
jgi:hypothetical protein